MRRASLVALSVAMAVFPVLARGEFDPSPYKPATQAELVNKPADNQGKKFRVDDDFQFCGSDFCVQVLKTRINTREYYCFTLGSLCLVRMYVKKDHPGAALIQKARRGDRVTVYGTFDYLGSNYHYIVVDHLVVVAKK